jgi:hypothetical protein
VSIGRDWVIEEFFRPELLSWIESDGSSTIELGRVFDEGVTAAQ